MKKVKTNTGVHEVQEPHTEKECAINEPIHSHPDVDCGHTVDAGPGKGNPKYDGHGGVIDAGGDIPGQDPGNGPGVN